MTTPLVVLTIEGNRLKITLTRPGRIELSDWLTPRQKGMDALLADLMEYNMCNGPWELTPPEEIGALTSSAIIGYEVQRDDHGNIVPSEHARFFWYPDYQVVDELKRLLDRGVLYFEGAPINHE